VSIVSNEAKRALITGITGQDGAYLSKLLIEKGYEVHGMLSSSASTDVATSRLIWLDIADRVTLHEGNLTDLSALIRILKDVRPAEVYNRPGSSRC
jgi:GDPmannose 4,6-dehydratase